MPAGQADDLRARHQRLHFALRGEHHGAVFCGFYIQSRQAAKALGGPIGNQCAGAFGLAAEALCGSHGRFTWQVLQEYLAYRLGRHAGRLPVLGPTRCGQMPAASGLVASSELLNSAKPSPEGSIMPAR